MRKHRLRALSFVGFAIQRLFPFHAAAFQVASASIDVLVNAPIEHAQARMMNQWRAAMLAQLSNVMLIGAIICATIVGSFTWPTISSISSVPYTIIQTMWYSSLVLGIAAVAVGLQQSVFLLRIGCIPNANSMLAHLLSYDAGGGRRAPRWDQVVLWQTAVGLLEWCLYTWLAGFVVFLWDLTKIGRSPGIADKVVASFCLLTFLAIVFIYVFSMLRLWYMAGNNKT